MSFWDKFFKKEPKSANNAKDRLKLVLQSDRTGLPPEVMEKIKNDIIEVISKYVEIDKEALDINISNEPSEEGTLSPTLFANIPIKEVKRNK